MRSRAWPLPVDGALDTDRNEQEIVRYGAFR